MAKIYFQKIIRSESVRSNLKNALVTLIEKIQKGESATRDNIYDVFKKAVDGQFESAREVSDDCVEIKEK